MKRYKETATVSREKKTQRGARLNEKTNRQARGRIRSRIGSFHGKDSCLGNPTAGEERRPGKMRSEGWNPGGCERESRVFLGS